jgi:DNA-binding NtrC family response regulator
MAMKGTILVIDDEKSFRIVADEALSREGYTVHTAPTGTIGLQLFLQEEPDVVILDRNLPDVDGVQLLERLVKEGGEQKSAAGGSIIIMATAYADVESAVTALKLGAHDYLAKPLQLPELIITVQKALDTRRLKNQLQAFRGRAEKSLSEFTFPPSAGMQRVFSMIDKVATSPQTTVLIQGESGTGKEFCATLIHQKTSGRADEPFIEINCASLPEQLLESELFGYERGAFTDAKQSKRGLFEAADRGTLFLDEIGELTPGTQAKLLKVLETMTFRRLGGTRDHKVDVRVVAATNKALSSEVAAGRFRLDLYHRLDVFHVQLPPLRERREDILPLARFFLERFAARAGKPIRRLSPQAEQILFRYSYPGNVRELRNLIERAVILEGGDEVSASSIVITGGPGPAVAETARPHFFQLDCAPDGTPPTLDQLERAYIVRLLDHAGGNRTQVARLLGVSYPTVAKKIQDYAIPMEKR